MQYIPSFGNLAFTLFTFIVALLVIVAVHEYGHYIVGRWSGIDADVFSLGFGPVIASRVDKRGTRWQIAAIPLGGYVKFRGDSDAASAMADLDAMDEAERRRSMHGAPLWARAAKVSAGPLFNFALSIIVFVGLLMVRGVATDPLTIADLPDVPYEHGLQVGDEILAIDGMPTPELTEFSEFANQLPVQPLLDYEVQRGDQVLVVQGPNPYPAIVSGVTPESASADAGLKINDAILAVDGRELSAFSDLQAVVAEGEGATLQLEIWRDGQVFTQDLTPRRTDLPQAGGGFETRWLIGINGGLWFEPATATPGIGEAIEYGVNQTWYIVKYSLSGLYHMATGQISTCNIRGPIGIAQTSSTVAAQGLVAFIGFIALLSTAVGLMNLFPIPVLDGGHLVFHVWEAITGKPPGDTAMRILMTVGLALIVTLMIFALSNDVLCP